MSTLEEYIITIPDFPEPGIMFRDITGIMDHQDGLSLAVDTLSNMLEGLDYDIIAGAEARGFIFGAPMAYKLGKKFVPIRKAGKLPRTTVSKSYDLEYGSATIEVHKDSVKPGDKVVLVDDLLATGGTISAAAELIEELGAEVVKIVFLIELEGLNGREKLKGRNVESAIIYPGI